MNYPQLLFQSAIKYSAHMLKYDNRYVANDHNYRLMKKYIETHCIYTSTKIALLVNLEYGMKLDTRSGFIPVFSSHELLKIILENKPNNKLYTLYSFNNITYVGHAFSIIIYNRRIYLIESWFGTFGLSLKRLTNKQLLTHLDKYIKNLQYNSADIIESKTYDTIKLFDDAMGITHYSSHKNSFGDTSLSFESIQKLAITLCDPLRR